MFDFFLEIVPLDRPSDDYHTSEFIDPAVEIKPEDLHEIKQEPADDNDNGDSHCYVKQEPDDEYETEGSCFTIQVSSMWLYSTDIFQKMVFLSHTCEWPAHFPDLFMTELHSRDFRLLLYTMCFCSINLELGFEKNVFVCGLVFASAQSNQIYEDYNQWY